MSTPALAGRAVLGLTHPAGAERWFGFRTGGHFFRLVDGDRYLAVLREPQATQLVDVVPFEGDGDDPRKDIRRVATDWAVRRGLIRRGK